MEIDSETVHIREIETVASHKGKLLRVTFEQRRRNGEIQRREREVYDNGDSAVILPHDPHRNTVLLTRQLRLPIFLRDGTERTLEACAGKLDGALAERRIVKEMEEELGYQIAKVQRLFDLYVSPAAIMERITFFTCFYSPADRITEGGGLKEEGEDIEVVEVTLMEAASMVAAGEIVDAKTVILIQYLSDRARASQRD
jgi:GDP-mannose pyrophosphatase NudK